MYKKFYVLLLLRTTLESIFSLQEAIQDNFLPVHSIAWTANLTFLYLGCHDNNVYFYEKLPNGTYSLLQTLT